MITKNLSKSLEEIGFTYVEGESSESSHMYAIYGDYMVSVYEEAGKKIAYFNFKFAENEDNDLIKYNMSESFSAEIDEYSVSDYTITDDGMRVYCTGNIAVFLKLIDSCITLLLENEIRGCGYCSRCGNKFGSRLPKKVTFENENHIMCDHCALEAVEESNERATQEKEEGAPAKKGKAILFSILFSILGVALYFVLYYWLSPAMSESGLNEIRYVFCVCGFITSLFAYLGYKLFCKKASIAAYVTVISNALIFTAIGQYIGVVFEYIAKNGFSLSMLGNKHFWLVHLRNTIPADVSEHYVDVSSVFWKLLIISLMFAAVGSAIFLLSLREKSMKKPEKVLVETISIK